jgi:hypothetical protein
VSFAARRDTDEFFFNFVVEKEEAREEENARSERDVDEVNMMMMWVLFSFATSVRLCSLQPKRSFENIFFFFSLDSILKP